MDCLRTGSRLPAVYAAKKPFWTYTESRVEPEGGFKNVTNITQKRYGRKGSLGSVFCRRISTNFRRKPPVSTSKRNGGAIYIPPEPKNNGLGMHAGSGRCRHGGWLEVGRFSSRPRVQ